MNQEEKWVELCSTCTDYEAHLIAGLLKSNGLQAELKSYRVSQFPFDIGHIGEIKIMVRAGDLQKAQEILENSDKNIKNNDYEGNET
ncbi:MAG: putative signal transducing protein [bacterium]